MKTLMRSAILALLAVVVSAPIAGAQVSKCQRTIAKANSQFLQARVKALAKCHEGIVKSGVAGTCPDSKASASITKAEDKLLASIGKSCGGDDKACGGNTNNEFLPPAIGWPSICPNFEKGSCTNAITDCNGIVTCLECIGGAATDQAMSLYYDSIVLQTSDKTLNKCQVTIGKATTAFLNSKSKALQKCWDARLNGKHSNPCDMISVGDGKYLGAITKAEDKKKASICKACGGPDKACSNGGDDLTPAAIGFPATCPNVTPPGQTACGGAISTLDDLVKCVDCVTEFKADCDDRLQVPEFAAYPTECNACTLPPDTGPCPPAITFTADGPNTQLDSGFTGLAHGAHVPTNGRLTLNVSGCAGTNLPTCGQCNVSGPSDNPGGVEFNNHRCQDASWIQCTSDADCTSATQCIGGSNLGTVCTNSSECPGGTCGNAGIAGPCIFFFGTPLPLVAGGVATCILNQITGPISGTINFDDGSSTTFVPLHSGVYPGGNENGPCPHCTAGTCDGVGPRLGHACSVQASSQFGDVSLDCPPSPGNLAGLLTINLNIATGTQTKTVTAANPKCRQTGYTGLNCLCDTCNNVNLPGCSTNADCPGTAVCVGGTNSNAVCADSSECPGGACALGAGICGGKRCVGGTEAGQPCGTCIGGSNHGNGCGTASACPGGTCANPKELCAGGSNDGGPCTNNSACPGGTCAECAGGGQCTRPGESPQPNVCIDSTTTPGLDCVDVGNNQGECTFGPSEQVCSVDTFHNCTSDPDCQPNVNFPHLTAGQHCISRNRPCFTDNGAIGGTVSVSGNPDPPCGGISKPTVGTFFCVAPVGASAVNAAGGLPGFGRVRIPGVVDLNP